MIDAKIEGMMHNKQDISITNTGGLHIFDLGVTDGSARRKADSKRRSRGRLIEMGSLRADLTRHDLPRTSLESGQEKRES